MRFYILGDGAIRARRLMTRNACASFASHTRIAEHTHSVTWRDTHCCVCELCELHFSIVFCVMCGVQIRSAVSVMCLLHTSADVDMRSDWHTHHLNVLALAPSWTFIDTWLLYCMYWLQKHLMSSLHVYISNTLPLHNLENVWLLVQYEMFTNLLLIIKVFLNNYLCKQKH